MVIKINTLGRHVLENKVNLLFQGKPLTAFVANDKNLCFQVKMRILENLNPSP